MPQTYNELKGNNVMQFVGPRFFCRWMSRAAACAALVLTVVTPSQAEVLATATYDTDSYVFFGTNSVTSPEITLGQPFPLGVDPHYNIGFIKFDVTALSLAGPKYLELEANTATAVLPSSVRVAQLYANTDGYFSAGTAASRSAWLHANAFAQPPVDGVNFSAAGGKRYADITSVVNHWINNPTENYGLALWRVGGADFDSPELFSMNDPGGRGPAINSVPEPGTVALGASALAIIAVAALRRRTASGTVR